ncbi:MAG: pyruvate dehydrogenase (acetyl-transferring) E1 component subunit alpha [Bdellovibrionales bacterium]|nr:pyruvate dehydrogenase (acetyl-transferring) E1 component subunit alpha [Bdellovibrionales bacterium]
MDSITILTLYRTMLLMRRFEEEAARAYTERKIGGFLHLYNGQEAVGAGVIQALREDDYVVTAYRDHAQYLARGGTARAGMAELFGKATGCSKGRGGSMHFFNAETRFMGGHGIVGAHVPLAAGLAFASKYREESSITACFLGDGAVNIGPFHEGLCLASVWDLPVLYIVENNFYAMGTPVTRATGKQEVAVRADGYEVKRKTVDGYDVFATYQEAAEAISYVRDQQKPMLLEFFTYRYRGHSMADPAKYRTKEEVREWQERRDPITVLENRIQQEFPDLANKLEEIRTKVEEEVADAVEFAETSPEPDPETVGDYTYV